MNDTFLCYLRKAQLLNTPCKSVRHKVPYWANSVHTDHHFTHENHAAWNEDHAARRSVCGTLLPPDNVHSNDYFII